MLAITLENVGFTYAPWLIPGRGREVLSGVSFEVLRGETLGVIGKNGSGKSTLMQILAGIVMPDSGKVSRYVERVQLLSLQLGFIQELTGRENAILSAMLLGVRKNDIEERMGAVIEFSGLGEYIDKPIKTYSAGMRARLGFAVSIQADPDVLLIDEAFSVGDAEFRKKSRSVIESRMNSSRAFVLVSHSENMLKEYCKRTLWMENGRIRMLGETASVVAAYGQDQVR